MFKTIIIVLCFTLFSLERSYGQKVAIGVTLDPLFMDFYGDGGIDINYNWISLCGIIQFDSTDFGMTFRNGFVSQRTTYLYTNMYVLKLGICYELEQSRKSNSYISLHGAWGLAQHEFDAHFTDGFGNKVEFKENKNHMNFGIGAELITIGKLIDNLYLYFSIGVTRQATKPHSFSENIEKLLVVKPYHLNTIDLNLGLILKLYQ